MKKLSLALLLLLVTFRLWGQSFYIGIDWSNALFGSDVNPPALNWKIGVSDHWNYNSNFMFGMEYESFNYLGFQQWTFAKLDYEIQVINKGSILVGGAFSQIYHQTSYSQDALSYMFNFEIDFEIIPNIRAFIQLQKSRATDIEQLWRESAYIGIKYKL